MCDGRLCATRSRNRARRPGLWATLGALITLASCAGGSSNTTESPPTAPSPAAVAASDAARLLEQATFGATASDIAHVQSIGIDAYISEQLAYAPHAVHRIHIATWFGADSQALATVLPNLSAFSPTTLGFI